MFSNLNELDRSMVNVAPVRESETEYLCPEECGGARHSMLVLQCNYDGGLLVDAYYYCPCCGWDCGVQELPEDIEAL